MMKAMPRLSLRHLAGRDRTAPANRALARVLAFVAGAANAGGFLAVRQYTSHMSGITSAMADGLAARNLLVVRDASAAIAAFTAGAAATTLLIRWARRHEMHSAYALPLLVEAALLVVFGLTGHVFEGRSTLGTVLLLCFTMGLQNAIVTKLSNAEIRTTHVTGMITDIGIALGRRIAAALGDGAATDAMDIPKLRLLSSLVVLFFAGGVVGAFGFLHVGFLFTLPLAALLLVLAARPVLDDLRRL
jgi:uncharacterized membrane protein YoaK (UPF0700 family)